MSAERCPTCGQILPAGLSKAKLARKISEDRDRAIAGALKRERHTLRKDHEAEMRTAWQEGRREGRDKGEQETKGLQRDLKTTQQQLAVEGSRRKDLEMTVRALQRKLSAGSAQRIGMLSQDDIRCALETVCPNDEFLVNPPGRRGADIVQTIREDGQSYGKILWEVKDTADWSEAYAIKARSDSQRVGADYVCLVTARFPKGTDGLAVRHRVVLIAPQYAGFLARVLRDALVQLGQARLAAQQRAVKAAEILDYVGSAECRARFNVIADGIAEMRKIQTNERNYHDEHWRKEENTLSKIATASTGIHGRLLAIARKSPVRLAARA
jgi:hypothetical protein